ncbi:MAG: PglZ domain-containing protein [Planctomycetes bacterium]|nr:PglZ domain-containing protein [Planctomycetota bacterium]
MSTASTTFRSWLCATIGEVLGRQSAPPPLLVWCDPDREWLELLRMAAEANAFELWAPASCHEAEHELIVRDRFYRTPPAPRVVWLPVAREGITWFKPFELQAEEVWQRPLLDALREYGVDVSRDDEGQLDGLLAAQAREWFDKPRETWKELTPANAKGTLVGDHRMLDVLAGPEGEFERLRAEGRFDFFVRRATEDFGFPDPAGQSERSWRIAATACVLCTDASDGSPREPLREPEKIIPPGLARQRALNLLKQWQHYVTYLASFEELVPEAERTTGLVYWARNLSAPPRSRSSRIVEQTLFDQAVDQLERLEDVDALARGAQTFKERESGFWGRLAARPVGWRFLCELAGAAALIVENGGVEEAWKSVRHAIDWYVAQGWRLDEAGERLFVEEPELPQQLVRLRARLRRGYLRTMDRVGRAHSELLAREPDKLFELPTAGELLLGELEQQIVPTAILFVDACRFELGQRLSGLLNQGEPARRASVSAAVAPVPTITPLGMSFALPIQREKLAVALSADGKSFSVTAAGFDGDLGRADKRRSWLKETLEIRDWLKIEEVLDGSSLKRASARRRVIAVHGNELDSHDGRLELTGADDHLSRYVQAIHRLRDAGFHRVIVVSDHGFFHWQPDEHDIEEELPTGEVLWTHRRAVVGRNLSHATAVRLRVPCSDLQVVVPRGTNAFRTYGSLGFFHGGATLQEAIVPVVVATWPAKARKIGVVLKPVGHITSEAPRVEVQAAADQRTMFGAESNLLARRVLVKVKDPAAGKLVFRHTDPVLVEPDTTAKAVPLVLVEPRPDLPYGTSLVIEVQDADDEQLLTREEVILKIEISDW